MSEGHTPTMRERMAPCPECGGDGGFEEAGSGRWSECRHCGGDGEVETEATRGLGDLEGRCGDAT